MEIERKFLVKDMEKVRAITSKYIESKKSIVQDYIYSDCLTAIRKRKIIKNGTTKYMYTVKTGRKGFSVNEYEEEITEDIYNSLELDKSRITIEKDRYVIPYEDNLKIELDVFHGEYEGVVFAEIEFESESQARSILIPDWFDRELSNEISNDKMSRSLVKIL